MPPELQQGPVISPASEFTYRLQVLTHGPDKTLTRTLRSFQEHVTPQPDEWAFHADGPAGRKAALEWEQTNYRKWNTFSNSWGNLGFCKSTAAAWKAASLTDCEYVFWLEHDFEFTRPVDLTPAARILIDPSIFQISLMRNAVSEKEKQAGGLFEAYRESWLQMEQPVPWLRHRKYFTTNPSLIPAENMRAWRWVDQEQECEGKFGFALIEHGYFFGVLGNGEPWVKHIGERNGKGY